MDRNHAVQIIVVIMYASLSARRAWIEIRGLRNRSGNSSKSLSARRAWIEICGGVSARLLVAVALRKESVDRNAVGR